MVVVVVSRVVVSIYIYTALSQTGLSKRGRHPPHVPSEVIPSDVRMEIISSYLFFLGHCMYMAPPQVDHEQFFHSWAPTARLVLSLEQPPN